VKKISADFLKKNRLENRSDFWAEKYTKKFARIFFEKIPKIFCGDFLEKIRRMGTPQILQSGEK
tara:strand:+ start:64 stop:255 length:192 start_codon:yes stop_codon:yes gene_type:complete